MLPWDLVRKSVMVSQLKVCFLCYCLLVIGLCHGQEEETTKPIVPYRPKIVEFSYNTMNDYGTISTSEEHGNSDTEFKNDNLIRLSVGVPLILKQQKKFGIQLKYASHRFVLDDDVFTQYALFRHLSTTTFRSLAARFLYERKVNQKYGWRISGGSEIKSDRLVWNRNSTKHFLNFSWKKQVNSRTSYGAGLVVGYTLGIFQAYPLFTYEHQVNKRLTLDFTLPKSLDFRYKANEGLYVIARTTFRGWRYNITEAVPAEQDQFTLRRSSLEISLNIEKEIHDWLWVGFNSGIMKNINYYLAEPGLRRRDAVINLEADDMLFVKGSVFIVPPGKFYR